MSQTRSKSSTLAFVASTIAVALPVLTFASGILAGVAHVRFWGSKAEDAFYFLADACGFASLPIALVGLTLSIRALVLTGRRVVFGILSLLDALAVGVGIWICMFLAH